MHEKEREDLIARMKYNSSDFGDMGRYIKLEYVINFLNDSTARFLNMAKTGVKSMKCEYCGVEVWERYIDGVKVRVVKNKTAIKIWINHNCNDVQRSH